MEEKGEKGSYNVFYKEQASIKKGGHTEKVCPYTILYSSRTFHFTIATPFSNAQFVVMVL